MDAEVFQCHGFRKRHLKMGHPHGDLTKEGGWYGWFGMIMDITNVIVEWGTTTDTASQMKTFGTLGIQPHYINYSLLAYLACPQLEVKSTQPRIQTSQMAKLGLSWRYPKFDDWHLIDHIFLMKWFKWFTTSLPRRFSQDLPGNRRGAGMVGVPNGATYIQNWSLIIVPSVETDVIRIRAWNITVKPCKTFSSC